eukprot:TRINITY_DN1267_c0_g1_i6.p2 TRINITY_DN1267_c0_g1~~TRINITY_DN1267_c0_g1_i6.p2  ORF type:complete len:205 (+),score=41.77 TRINITY_DN1267_c0_g1_i6:171-785(+)
MCIRDRYMGGKTNIIRSISGKPFQPKTMTTLGLEFETKIFDIDDKKIKVQIWDTAGQERLHAITRNYYQGSNGMILVYSVIERESFEHISNWMEEINKYGSSNVSIILVGNKIDLPNREVSTEEGQQLADKFKLPFFEASAKTGENVEKIFVELGTTVKNKLFDQEKKSTNNNDDNKINVGIQLTPQKHTKQNQTNTQNKKCCQ